MDYRVVGEVDFDPFEGQVEEPAQAEPAPATPPAPAPSETAEPPPDYVIPPRSSFKIPKIVRAPEPEPEAPKPNYKVKGEVDFDPFPEEAAKPEPKSNWGIVRGLAGGLGGNVESWGGTLDVIDALSGGDNTGTLAGIGKSIKDIGGGMTEGYDLQEPTISGVGSVGEFGTYLSEQLGNALGSMVSGVLSTVAGGAAGGAIAGPVGAAVGAPAAALTQGMWTGVGDMNNSLTSDAGVQEALKSGKITRQQAAYISLAGGLAIGALDATGILKVTGPAGKAAKEVAQETVKKGVLAAIKEGAFAEGGTEALQEVISQSLQAMTGGNVDAFARAMSVVDATVGGLLGGGTISGATSVVSNEGEEQPAKPDDQPEVAAPVTQEGTPVDPAAVVDNPAGGVSAGTPPPPAGAEKVLPPTAPVETPDAATDPRTPAKPPTAAPADPVIVVKKGDVPADIGVAIGTPPTSGAGPANIPGGTRPVDVVDEDEDIEEEPVGESEVLPGSDRPPAVDPVPVRERAAETITVPETAANDGDIKQALAAIDQKLTTPLIPMPAGPGQLPTGTEPVPVPQTNATPQQETLGTGQALRAPEPAPADIVPESPLLREEAAAPLTAPGVGTEAPASSAQVLEPAPAFTPIKEVDFDPFAGEDLAAAPTTEATPAGEAPKAVKVKKKAKLKASEAEAQRADYFQPGNVVEGYGGFDRVTDYHPPDESGRWAVEVERVQLTPEGWKATEGKRSHSTPPSPRNLKQGPKERVATEKPAESVEAKEAPAPQPAAPAKPAAAPKAEALKKKAVPKGAGAKKAAPPIAGETQRVTREEATAPRAVVAEVTERAKRTPLQRDISDQARTELKRVRETRAADLVDFNTTVDETTDEVLADNPRPQTQSINAYMNEMAEKISDRVEEKLAPQLASIERERQRLEEAKTPEGRAKQAEEKRIADMAAAAAPQKKERAGKKKGKSATGIRAEDEQATSNAVKKELEKPEGERDPHVMQWAELRKQRAQAKGEDAKKAVTEKMKAVQEERALAAEKKAEESDKLTPRAKAADKAVKAALPPSPTNTKSLSAEHVRQLNEAFKGLELSGRINTKHQTPAENFAVWIRSKVATGKKISDETQAEAFLAHKLLEVGDHQHLYEVITSEVMEGLGTKGDVADFMAAPSVEEDEQEMRRGGAAGARARGESVAARAAKGEQGRHSRTVTKPDGTEVQIKVDSTRKASAVLAEVNTMAGATPGFIGMLQSMLTRRLSQLVGDVDVHIVSPETMAKLGKAGAAGLYYNYGDAMRAAGMKPMVFINSTEAWDTGNYTHTVLHELTHAATSQAVRDNLHGLGDVLTGMRKDLLSQLREKYSAAELEAAGLKHAFTSNAEFVAEAFTNKKLQKLLGEAQVPTQLRASVQRLIPNRAPTTWWDAFTAAVSKAVGVIRGTRGQTYIEQIIKLDPVLFRSEAAQAKRAKDSTVSAAKAQAFAPELIQALDRGTIDQAKQHVSQSLRFGAGSRHMRDVWSTTAGIMRDSAQTWGNNLLHNLGRLALRKDEIFKERRRSPGEGIDNQKMEEDFAAFESKHQKQAEKLESFLNDATIFEIDPTVGLNHTSNSHVSKKGARSSQQRNQHAKLSKEWAALSPEAQAMGKRLIEHYRRTGDLEVNAIIREAFQNAMKKFNNALPAGKTIEDAIAWVRSGGAARKLAERTAEDHEWHKALGKTAESMADVKELSRKKGIYVPLHRQGKFFISASDPAFDKTNPPHGAIEVIGDNQLVFKDVKAAEAFRNTQDGYTRLTFRHVDPNNPTVRVSKDWDTPDPAVPGGLRQAERQYIVTVQNKLMEMSDNEGELKKRRQELIDKGMEVSEVRLSGSSFRQAAEDISSPQIKRLLKNVGQTTLGATPVGQQALHDAILDAHIRSLTSPGHLQRRLKRKNVKGEVSSTLKALQAYNRSIGNHLANLEIQQQISEAHSAAQKFIDSDSRNRVGKRDERTSQDRQSQLNEIVDRIRNVKNETTEAGYQRILANVRNYAVLRYLASPHYVMMQGIQFYTGSIPVLAKHGASGYAAMKALHEALAIGGGWTATAGRMGSQFKKAAKGEKQADLAQDWRDAAAKESDGAQLVEVLDEVNALGFGVSNSVEAPSLVESEMNRVERMIHRGVNVAMAPAQAIEASNRNSMAIAAYRLGVRQGLSHEKAMQRAVLAVEEAQGGYGAGNFASVFRNPLLASAMQFRKYGVSYAGVYYRALNRSLRGATAEEKKSARRQLGYMTLMTGMFAGVFGQAAMEVARTLVITGNMLGFLDDTWEEDENEMQAWLADLLGWATGNDDIGDRLSEAVLRGPTRLMGVDTAGSLSNDNTLTFGQPKKTDAESTMDWLLKSLLGASGGMGVDMIKEIAKVDSADDMLGIIPMPKIMESGYEATKKLLYGTQKPSGEQQDKPSSLTESLIETTGFKPAEQSRKFEAKGEVATSRAMKKERAARTSLMGQWRARDRHEQRQFFRTEIREWNRTHKGKERIDYSDLMRSVRSAKERKKELEEEMAE